MIASVVLSEESLKKQLQELSGSTLKNPQSMCQIRCRVFTRLGC